MVQTDLLQVAELDFVCSVLADPAQFREVQHITPDVLGTEPAQAIWKVVYPLLSSKGAASATYVYGELANFEAGRKVIAQYPTIELFRSLWNTSKDTGPAAQLADTIQQQQILAKIELIYRHVDKGLSPADQAIVMSKALAKAASSVAPITDDFLLSESVFESLRFATWRAEHPEDLVGWRTGDPQYDAWLKKTTGLDGGKVIVTAAGSGYGKSHWLVNQTMGFLQTPRDTDGALPRVAFFSMEMTPRGMSDRFLAHKAEVPMDTRDPNKLVKLANAAQWIANLNQERRLITVHGVFQIEAIRRKIYQLVDTYGTDIVVIDYIGMIQGTGKYDGSGTYESIGEIVKILQHIANDLNILIVTAAQLNRTASQNMGGRGSTANIADSHTIERVADLVHIMWRPELHNREMVGEDLSHWKNVLVLETPKCRFGENPKRPFYYRIDYGRSAFTQVPIKDREFLESPEQQRIAHGIRERRKF